MSRRLFALVAAVIVLDTAFYSAITPLLPGYADDLDLSKTAAGVLNAAYAAGTLIAALPSGWLAARIGFKPAMLAGLVLIGASSLVFAFANSIVLLDLARFAEGVGGACAWTGGLAWLLAVAPDNRRGEMVGAALAAAVFGILVGPVIGALASVIGTEPVFSAVAAGSIGIGVWVATTAGAPVSARPELAPVVRAIFARPVLLAFWLVVLPAMLAGTFSVLVPLHLDRLGAGAVAVGVVFFVSAAIEAFVSPGIGRLSDRRGRALPIRIGLVTSAATALLLPVPDTVVLVAVALIATVLAMSLIWTPAMALLSERAEEAGLDLAFGTALVSLAWAGGQVLGGSGFSKLADASSDGLAFAIIALAYGLTFVAFAGLGLPRALRRAGPEPAPAGQQRSAR